MSELTTKLLDMILEVNPDYSYLSDVKVHHFPADIRPLGIHGVGMTLPFFRKRMFILCGHDINTLSYLMSHEIDHLDYFNRNGFARTIYAAYFPHKRLGVERGATERGLSTVKKLSEKYSKINYDGIIERIKNLKYSRNPIMVLAYLIYYRNLRLD